MSFPLYLSKHRHIQYYTIQVNTTLNSPSSAPCQDWIVLASILDLHTCGPLTAHISVVCVYLHVSGQCSVNRMWSIIIMFPYMLSNPPMEGAHNSAHKK